MHSFFWNFYIILVPGFSSYIAKWLYFLSTAYSSHIHISSIFLVLSVIHLWNGKWFVKTQNDKANDGSIWKEMYFYRVKILLWIFDISRFFLFLLYCLTVSLSVGILYKFLLRNICCYFRSPGLSTVNFFFFIKLPATFSAWEFICSI